MIVWHIIVEAVDGCREIVGKPDSDLGSVMTRALALADELGRICTDALQDRRVDIVAADGHVELSITIISGGLDPEGALRESSSKTPGPRR